MSTLFRRFAGKNEAHDNDARAFSSTGHVTAHGNETIVTGDLKYVGEKGGNGDTIAFQEASGAPVETQSPLGYSVGPITIIFLNISKM